jgi:SulP family sulfate permease
MVEVGALRALGRASRQDALILAVTFLLTIMADLVTAVALGIGVAVILALRSVANSAHLEPMALEPSEDHSEEEHRLLHEHVVAFRLDGPLFFAAAHRFLLELSEVAVVKVVILRMSRVSAIDVTGARVLDDAIRRLEHRGILVLLSGIKPGHKKVLQNVGLATRLRAEGRVFTDTPSAIEYAYAIVGHGAGREPVVRPLTRP